MVIEEVVKAMKETPRNKNSRRTDRERTEDWRERRRRRPQ